MKRLVLGLGVLVVAGCGGATGAIAWKPVHPVAPGRRLAPPCGVKDLSWSPHEFNAIGWVGATGDLGGGILVTNVSAHPCSLLGRAHVRFSGAVRTDVHSIPPYGDDPLNRPPVSSLRALGPGNKARLALWWRQSWCGAPPAALAVTLNGNESTKRFVNREAPRCNNPGARGTSTWLGVSRWVPDQEAPPALPLEARLLGRLGSHHEVVYSVRKGQVLQYEVALTNVSKRPFAFRTCPLYTLTVDRTDAFVLNCRSVGTLKPGRRAVFEMRLLVSKPIGGFLWALNAANGTDDHAEVIVTR